jgi:hypothetical protein
MRQIILCGGIIRGLLQPPNLQAVNIKLIPSPVWHNGTIYVGNVPYYKVWPDIITRIEVLPSHNQYNLMVNDNIIYQNRRIFTYEVDVKLSRPIDLRAMFYSFYN